jgi:hypothetical protein
MKISEFIANGKIELKINQKQVGYRISEETKFGNVGFEMISVFSNTILLRIRKIKEC